MRRLSSKEISLSVLVVGLIAVVLYQYDRGAFSRPNAAEAKRAAVKELDPKKLPGVAKVDLNEPPPPQIRKNSRNLFNYSRSPTEIKEEEDARARAAALAKEAEERRRQAALEQAQRDAEAAKVAASLPPPPPPAPPINFQFIGKMGDPKSIIAILADGTPGGEVIPVHEGDVIRGDFKIEKIEFESVTIGYVNPLYAGQSRTIKMGS